MRSLCHLNVAGLFRQVLAEPMGSLPSREPQSRACKPTVRGCRRNSSDLKSRSSDHLTPLLRRRNCHVLDADTYIVMNFLPHYKQHLYFPIQSSSHAAAVSVRIFHHPHPHLCIPKSGLQLAASPSDSCSLCQWRHPDCYS